MWKIPIERGAASGDDAYVIGRPRTITLPDGTRRLECVIETAPETTVRITAPDTKAGTQRMLAIIEFIATH